MDPSANVQNSDGAQLLDKYHVPPPDYVGDNKDVKEFDFSGTKYRIRPVARKKKGTGADGAGADVYLFFRIEKSEGFDVWGDPEEYGTCEVIASVFCPKHAGMPANYYGNRMVNSDIDKITVGAPDRSRFGDWVEDVEKKKAWKVGGSAKKIQRLVDVRKFVKVLLKEPASGSAPEEEGE